MFKKMCSGAYSKMVLAGLGVAVVALVGAGQAQAQAPDDPNPGALTFTGGLDVPSVYFFRGIRQEFDAKMTLFPYGDIGIALSSDGKGGLKSSSINFGVWNSLNTGTSGSDGPSGRIHYEEDFYTTLNLGFGGGVGVATTFTAYTSPNGGFGTIQELSFKVTKAHMLNPYGLLAFEVGGDGSSDGGSERGTYLELGVGPSWPLGGSKVTIAVPVKFGFSLSNYYESGGEDHSFGFFDVGALLTVPLSRVSSRFGSWNIHAGGDYFLFGDTPESFNLKEDGGTKSSQFIALFGIGVSY